MKTIKTAAAAGVALAALAGSAAAENREFSWSITMAGTSDYVFRGLSFNDERPAFQPAVDFSYGIAYLGFWGSNIDGAGFEPWELDIYAGITPSLGPVNFDFGIIYYTYPMQDAIGTDTDYIELKAGASMDPVENMSVGVTGYYTPDTDNYGETYTVEGSVSYAFPAMGIVTPSVSGLVGYSEFLDGTGGGFFGTADEYTYWNAGIGLDVDKWSFDFRYWDTDQSNNGLADERFVFTTSISLP